MMVQISLPKGMDKLKEFFGNKNWSNALSDPKIIGTAAAVVVAFYYIKMKRQQVAFSSSFENQSIEFPGPEFIRANAKSSSILDIDDVECKTLHELFMNGVQISGKRPFLGTRRDANSVYEWITYDEVYEKSQYVGSALYDLGYKKGDLIGISAMNRPEWVMVDQGAIMFSMALVPLYSTLGIEGMQHILHQTEITIAFCDVANLKGILDGVEATRHLKTVVTFEKVTDQSIVERCIKLDLKVLEFSELLELGKHHHHKKVLPEPGDLALVCYTSGTTGKPKGVMLTHRNLVTNIESFKYSEYHVDQSDIHISYLPLSHMYERTAEYLIMGKGGRIGFFRGIVKELVKDVQTLKPTMFAAVPRVFNVLHDKIMNEVSRSWIKSFMFKLAINAKQNDISRGIIRRDTFWDRLIFHKIQDLLGGRIRVIISGAAPLSESVKQFFKCAFGCLVYEGYGQTELTAMATTSYALDPSIGHVGPPAPCCHIKLADVPEMDYYAKGGEGEVCVRGSNVFQGYFKDPEKTRETIDEAGWCHTGDIGRWLPNGTLCIIDRKKHIFKLAQGEYIAPEKVENVYMRSQFVSQIYVTGNSFQTCTVAIVCPDHDVLKQWANKHHYSDSIEELCKNENVNKVVLESIREIGAEGGLNSLEQVKAVYLTSEGFTIESDLLTPTMKVKRNKVEEKFASEIAFLYKSLKNN